MAEPQRYNSAQGCVRAHRVLAPSAAGEASIAGSVGVGGRNAPADVRTVQQLLNDVPPDQGGPSPKLAVDGLAGPLTNAAIAKFQKKQLGFSDGRVDPGGPTIKRLNQFRRGVSAGFVLAPTAIVGVLRDTLRLAMAEAALPDIIKSCRRAEQTASAAADFKMLGPGALTTSPEAFEFADRHFKFGDQSDARTIAELRFIEVTFRRMKRIAEGRRSSTGASGFGASIFAIDPDPEQTEKERRGAVKMGAYVPLERFEQPEGYTPFRIYLCEGLDGRTHDEYVHMLTHELAHFADDEHESTVITDRGYSFDGSVMRLSHEDRMHNAENYALFAFERSFGKARLLAINPKLAPMLK